MDFGHIIIFSSDFIFILSYIKNNLKEENNMAKDNNWSKKIELSHKAYEHTHLMDKYYGDDILNCKCTVFDDFGIVVAKKKAFDENRLPSDTDYRNRSIIVSSDDTVSAVYKALSPEKTAIMNFASYKNPGGMFLEGSMAQEEALCHESILYNVLCKQEEYYSWNRDNLNCALYLNRALYSENVVFRKNNDDFTVDVITCAAPNFSAASRYCGVSREENNKVLLERVRFVVNIAAVMGVKTFIAGAWGCGVFGQDPKTVAECFKTALVETTGIDTVIFAIPGNGNGNLEAFQNAF